MDLSFEIKTSAELGGAQAAGAAMDKLGTSAASAAPKLAAASAAVQELTNTGAGLASSVPGLDDFVKAFVITTESEYRSIVKAHEALRARLPVMAAAGQATDKLTASLAKLDAALSTETALQIAENIEQKKATAAKLEEAEAIRVKTAALFEEGLAAKKSGEIAEAAELSNAQLRRTLRGIGRIEGPAAGRALSELAFGPVGAGLALLSVYEMVSHKLDEMSAAGDEAAKRASEAFADVKANLFDAIRAEEFPTDKIDKYFEHFKHGVDLANQLATAQARLEEATLSGQDRIDKANEDLALARVHANAGLTPDQKSVAEEEIRQRYAQIAMQRELDKNKIPVTEAIKKLEIANNAQTNLEIQKRNLVSATDRDRVEKAMASPDVDKGLKAQYDAMKASGDHLDFSAVVGEASIKDSEQLLEDRKKALGLDEHGAMATGGDAWRLEQARIKLEDARKMAGGLEAVSPGTGVAYMKHEGQQAKDEVEKLQATVDADKKAIAQAETQLAIAKQTEAYGKKLNEALEHAAEAVEAANQKLKDAQAMAGVSNDATATAADSEARAKALEAATNRLKGHKLQDVIGQGATATDDLARAAAMGLTPAKINADYQTALRDKQQGFQTENDPVAIARENVLAADQQAMQLLQDYFTTIGQNSQSLIAIIQAHQRLGTSHSDEIRQLWAAVQAIEQRSAQGYHAGNFPM